MRVGLAGWLRLTDGPRRGTTTRRWVSPARPDVMSSTADRLRAAVEQLARRRSASRVRRTQRRVDADAVRLEHKKRQGSKFMGGGGGGG